MMRLAATFLILMSAGARATEPSGPSAEEKAIAFLAREVPRWERENRCHSCHNNGDAFRALSRAAGLSRGTDRRATAETVRWLRNPEGWERNGGEGPFNDRRLARLQFTLALGASVEAGWVTDRAPLIRAAERLAGDQGTDGAWPIEGETIGSPASYGRPLATVLARRLLRDVDAARFREPIARADRWLLGLKAVTIPAAAAVLMRGGPGGDPAWDAARGRALALLRSGQSSDGGWGPYRSAPPEVFDTALALLALARGRDEPGVGEMIRRGRSFLVAAQRPDGDWPETTRPTGGESYAQRISTAGWATLALLETK